MGVMVVCEAGLVLGSTGCLWSWERWLVRAAEIQLLQKIGLLSAPPLSVHPILMLFLLVCYSCIHVLPRASFLDLMCTNR